MLLDVYNQARVDSQEAEWRAHLARDFTGGAPGPLSAEEKPPATRSRTAFRCTVGIDLCAGCDLRKEGVTVNLSGRQS